MTGVIFSEALYDRENEPKNAVTKMTYWGVSLENMGYRRLLKSYLQHVEQLLGSTLVETVSESELFRKRDIGELKSIVAELNREAANQGPQQSESYNALLAETIRGYGLSVEEVANLSRISTAKINAWCYGEPDSGGALLRDTEFAQILFAILSRQIRGQPPAANPPRSKSPDQQTANSRQDMP